MGLPDIHRLLEGYDLDKLTVATFCSHTSMQIFHGARAEGFRTLGICLDKPPKFYSAFPRGKPDSFLSLDSYKDLSKHVKELAEENTIIVPTGSVVEYLGGKEFTGLELPTFGNRRVLEWEESREKQREWLESAGIPMPKLYAKPEEIDRPVLVKLHGAKGGKGAFIAKNLEEYQDAAPTEPHTIQEYIVGTRYYLHFFYSPIVDEGYTLSKGSLQLLGMDRRDESNIDEMYKLGSAERLKKLKVYATFVVTGNIPIVIRESLLPKAFEMAEHVVESSVKLFGGMIGPFCLETIVTDKLKFRVFEISSRIVAGTNLYVSSSPYTDLIEDGLSTGRRIAKEIRIARKKSRLDEVLS